MYQNFNKLTKKQKNKKNKNKKRQCFMHLQSLKKMFSFYLYTIKNVEGRLITCQTLYIYPFYNVFMRQK